MKRTRNNKKASLIACADIHLRPDSPKCRMDDFQEVMWGKWEEILNLSIENDSCHILCAGDLGHKPEWPNWLLEKFISFLYDGNGNRIGGHIFVCPGQHDMPNHSIDLLNKSAIGVLNAADIICILRGNFSFSWTDDENCRLNICSFPFGFEVEKPFMGKDNIAMTHQLVIEKMTAEWEQEKATEAISLLKQFPGYALILSGDNHKPFVVEYENRLLVNPGSMMRTTAIQIDHKPRVYKWYAEENKVEPHYLKIKKGVISREHIEAQDEKEKRMEAFVASIKQGGEIKLSYEDNMESYLKQNFVDEGIKKKIWQSMEVKK